MQMPLIPQHMRTRVIPAIVLLLASAAFTLPVVRQLPSVVWTDPVCQGAMPFLIVGGGVAAAVVLLVHTAVLALVRGRARRRLRAHIAATG